VHNIEGSYSLATSVLGVCHSITDDVLKEYFKNATSFLIDETGDTLNTTTTSEAANSRLRDALDVITKNLSVALCTTLAETLSAFSTTRHFD
jgi:hypothetical protein